MRRRALALCALGLLAVPAAASARLDLNPQAAEPQAPTVSSDIQSSPYPSGTTGSLPASFATDVQSGGYRIVPAAVASPQPSVVHEIHTVSTASDTLALVLASIALGIVLMAAGYGAFRMTTRRSSVGGLA